MLRFFGKHSQSEWSLEMYAHNLTYEKAMRMGLFPLRHDPNLRFVSLDLFLLQMHADKISEVLESWIAFAQRVLPLIQGDNDAASWRLSRKLLIHRSHWFVLSKRIMNVVNTIRLLAEDGHHHLHSRWPGQDRLFASAQCVAHTYCRFASSNEQCQSLAQLHDDAAAAQLLLSHPALSAAKRPRTGQ